jgi:DNA-directed RNA polymerase subunit RPC12/RpoP
MKSDEKNRNHQGKQALGEGVGRGCNKGGALGPGGYCICAKCGKKVAHQRGVKCTTLKCPQCGHTLVRKELLYK